MVLKGLRGSEKLINRSSVRSVSGDPLVKNSVKKPSTVPETPLVRGGPIKNKNGERIQADSPETGRFAMGWVAKPTKPITRTSRGIPRAVSPGGGG